MSNERIGINDSVQDVFVKLSEGNPGALTVLMKIYNEAEKIDPDNILGGLGVMLSLDTYKIYGTDIWYLYKDICNNDIKHLVAILRACQLNIFELTTLKLLLAVLNDRGYLDKEDIPPFKAIIETIQKRLPKFGK